VSALAEASAFLQVQALPGPKLAVPLTQDLREHQPVPTDWPDIGPSLLSKSDRVVPIDRDKALDEAYVFEQRSAVVAFIQEHRIRNLLFSAIPQLNDSFGERMKTLVLETDDEGAETLFCLVAWTGPLDDARRALESFDRDWWLANCLRAHGKLNFDFSLI
jgi:hypothetical protein